MRQTTTHLGKRAGFDDVGHRLGLTTGAQVRVLTSLKAKNIVILHTEQNSTSQMDASNEADMHLPDYVDGSWPHFGIFTHDGNTRGERSINAEHSGIGVGRQNGQVEVTARMITSEKHVYSSASVSWK